MTTTLESFTAITSALLAQLAANPHSSAVLVQDAIGAVHVLDHLTRFQLEDPDTVVLLTRAAALAMFDQQAAALTAVLQARGDML